jgi:hypothetical protein
LLYGQDQKAHRRDFMNDRSDLHLKRLRESLQTIDDFIEQKIGGQDPSFRSWKQRVKHSLGELFGTEHDYTRRFSNLQFGESRIMVQMSRNRPPRPSPQDQIFFEKGMGQAKSILEDALEEVDFLPPNAEPVSAKAPLRQPQIVVNIHNLLSQTNQVEISHIMLNLDNLGLPPEQHSRAKAHAEELAKEALGEQRWPVLAKSLDALKSMGKLVYENVALPLVLEMLKRQTGLDS